MAKFYVFRRNKGTKTTPQFRVSIGLDAVSYLPDKGIRMISECATVQELDEAVEKLIGSVKKAHDTARGILEENTGII